MNLNSVTALLSIFLACGCGAIFGSQHGVAAGIGGGMLGAGIGFCIALGVFRTERLLAASKLSRTRGGSGIEFFCLIAMSVAAPFVAAGASVYVVRFLAPLIFTR